MESAIVATCQEKEATYAENDMWFFDDPRELTNLRNNWQKGVLDKPLNLTDYCGKIT